LLNFDMTEFLRTLEKIREVGPYSSRNASKGAMLQELYQIAISLPDRMTKEELKRFIFIENRLNKVTYENRKAIWNRLNYRYFSVCPEWVGTALANEARGGNQSPGFLSLAYLYYVLRDRLTYEFVTGPVWDKWRRGTTDIAAGDFYSFQAILAESAAEVGKWSEKTRGKLGSITLTALRDFGLLRGRQLKYIQRPPVAEETVYHLLAILWAEGKRGQGILEALDWRLFLWGETDIADALTRLAQKGWIRFERGGQTVILEMIRLPGDIDA
jgi:hypothetical protein